MDDTRRGADGTALDLAPGQAPTSSAMSANDTLPPPAGHNGFPVNGMTCASCVGRVELALRAVPGVEEASVNLLTGRADVRGTAPPDALRAAVERAGYAVPEAETTLDVAGMTCASCVGRVERAFLAVPGVTGAAVNLATGRATVRHHGGMVPAGALASAAACAGYTATPHVAGHDAAAADPHAGHAGEERTLRAAAILASVLAVPALVLEMGGHLVPAFHHWVAGTVGTATSWWVQAAFATVAMLGPGRVFHRLGWPALARGAPDMNSLVALGTGAAWLYSAAVLLAPGLVPEGQRFVYFEAASVIIALVLVGRWLEARSRGRASAAIRRLMELAPATARVERDGREEEVPAAKLAVGDILVLRPGERVPTDADILDGHSEVSEAMVTGEPMPVPKGPGDSVVGGTVNGAGALRLRATAVGSGTTLARIARMVGDAQGSKLPIQAMVDRVTLWFVPAVVALAALTFAAWLLAGGGVAAALTASVAVLVIACPCAMGLATPVSILVGTGRAAELGVLFRRGAALQALSGVRTVAMDKTGTLTEGRPALADLVPAPGWSEAEALAVAAALEARSEHPLAHAVREAAVARGLALSAAEGFAMVPGGGVSGRVGGREAVLGSDRLLAGRGVDLAVLEAPAAALAAEGRTPVFLAVDGRAAALLDVSDPVRTTTPAALEALRGLGLRLAMVTGDDPRAAGAVAAGLGIADVAARVTPEGKVATVRGLGAGVAFVGDGINDAPALAAASVGIAVGGGTDIAVESAEVVLMRGDLAGVATAVRLSRATMRNIRQNLVWAFGYNAVLIPVAALGLLSPVLAAGAMALSSVCVVGNALRLRASS
jgi:heavy metal translocating P-type ATPase